MNAETATPAATQKAPKIEQHGVVRPNAGTKTVVVWEVADSLSAALGAPAPRNEVLKAVEAQGINASTAATQYGKWRKFNGLEKEKGTAKAVAIAAAETAVASDTSVE